jgi:hypothetical protein
MARPPGTDRPIDGVGREGRARLKRGHAKLGLLSRGQLVLWLLGTIPLAWLAGRAPAPEDARMRLACVAPGATVVSLAFSPDGKSIATAHSDRRCGGAERGG